MEPLSDIGGPASPDRGRPSSFRQPGTLRPKQVVRRDGELVAISSADAPRGYTAEPHQPGDPWSRFRRGHGTRIEGLRRSFLTSVAGALLAIGVLTLSAPAAQAAGPPQINSAWATDVTATSAGLHAQINPNGLPTTYRFEYLTESAYLENLNAQPPREPFDGAVKLPPAAEASIGSSSIDQEALRPLAGLRSATAYRYRFTSKNSAGTAAVPAHSFTTQDASTVFALPDQRGWEMVSPVDKNGGEIQGFGGNYGGDVLQAAAGGAAITYSSASSFAAGGLGAPAASQYLAHRGASGWSTENITIPALSGSYGDSPDGVPYQLFAPDLTSGLVLNGEHCRGEGTGCPVANPPLPSTEAPAGYQNYYLRHESGFTAVLTLANSAGLSLSSSQFDLHFVGASPDLGHLILSTCAALTPDATEVPGIGGGCDPTDPNLYEWSGSTLHLINLLPGALTGATGAELAAQSTAISTDGSRVYWGAGGNLYLRRAAEQPQSSLDGEGKCTEPARACTVLAAEGAQFQTASADGSEAFFVKEGRLYRYGAQAGTSELLASEVQGVLGISEDGSYVYYLSAGGLFLSHDGTTTVVAGSAAPTDYPPSTGTARVTPDGTHLAFLALDSLTGYDNTDATTGNRDSEVFLYTASSGTGSGNLICVSCNATNERPLGPSTIPGAIANGAAADATNAYKPRVLSADGDRLFFDSGDGLVLQDTNIDRDVYEWEAQGSGSCQRPGGCVGLISSGRSTEGASFVDASADGSDVFFLTDGSLVPSDPGSVDLYDSRASGGFPQPPAPIACVGDDCQNLPPQPEDPTPGTLVPSSGNPPAHFQKSKGKKPHHKRHHGKHKRARRTTGAHR